MLDQTHPICNRCSKGNFICKGYRDTLFIDGGAKVQQQLHNRSMLLRRSKSINSSETSQEPQRLTDQTTKSPGPSQSQHEFPHGQGLHSSTSLSVSPWKDTIVLSYLVADLGSMGAIYREIESSQRRATKQCFLALATTFFGVGHAEQSIVTSGRRHYSRALTMLNAAIGDLGRHGMTETLSSVVALILHEVSRLFECS